MNGHLGRIRKDDDERYFRGKKLVSRAVNTLLELSKNRFAVKKRRQRKNDLEYV